MGSPWCGNYGAYALFDAGHSFMIFVNPKLGEEPSKVNTDLDLETGLEIIPVDKRIAHRFSQALIG
jgi:hypothetical protein